MTHEIGIRDHAFHPEKLSITAGDCVIWTNHDQARHSAKRTEEPAFYTGRLAKGESSQPICFPDESPEEGFAYFCDPHTDMLGSIVVAARDQDGLTKRAQPVR